MALLPDRRGLAALIAVVALISAPAEAAASMPSTLVAEKSAPVAGKRTFRFARPATHVAVHWRGSRDAHVDVALSRDGRRFGRLRHVQLDEIGRRSRDGRTYGQIMVARGVEAVRVVSDRRLRRVTVLSFRDRGRSRRLVRAAGHVTTTGVIPRSGWGADESLRFDRRGREIWSPTYWDVQKLIVHHTAGQNDDPDPAATIRSIYHYHAVTQGWGDIGYNFLVDEAGRVYEGRYSGEAGQRNPPVDSTPGEDGNRNGVTAGHAYGYNAGTVGVALLGTLTDEDAAGAARTTLEEVLAWGSERHELDPLAAGTYTNPVTGASTAGLPNVLSHRDVAATECPGEILDGSLQALRDATALRLQFGTGSKTFALAASTSDVRIVRGNSAAVDVNVTAIGGFTGAVTLGADGLPSGAPVSFSAATLAPGNTATATISTTKSTPVGTYLLRVQGSHEDPATALRDARATALTVQIARR